MVTANTQVMFNGTDLSDIATFIPRDTDHQMAPGRDMNMLKTARSDGSKLISSWWKEKYIVLNGYIQQDTQATLENKIDAFKATLSYPAGTLSYSWDASGTREYQNATVSDLKIIRDSDHRDWCEFSVTFLVPSGKGFSTVAENISYPGYTAATKSFTWTIEGSATAHPIFTIQLFTVASFTNIALESTSDFFGETHTLNFPAAYNSGDVLVVDFGTFEVTLNGSPLDYTGAWPTFGIGDNDVVITFTSASHTVNIDATYFPEYI